MRPKLKIMGPGTYQSVRDAFDNEMDVKRKRKLQVIRLGFTGEYSSEQISEIAGCSKASVTNWVRDYRQGGLCGLLTTRHRSGRQPSLDEKAVAELLQGLEKGRWKRMKEIRAWLSKEHGTVISLSGVQYWLRKGVCPIN